MSEQVQELEWKLEILKSAISNMCLNCPGRADKLATLQLENLELKEELNRCKILLNEMLKKGE